MFYRVVFAMAVCFGLLFATTLEAQDVPDVSVFAGTGVAGSSGDGGPANQAMLAYPTNIDVDNNDNVYVVEPGMSSSLGSFPGVIRKINSSGIIATLLKSSKDSVSVVNGDSVFNVAGMVVKGTYVYITDDYAVGPGNRVTKISSANGSIFSILADTFNEPSAIAIDSHENVYVVEEGNRIMRVTPAGEITRFAGTRTSGFAGDGGPATQAQLSNVRDIAIDASDNVYIVDGGNRRIRKVDANGIITTMAGNGVVVPYTTVYNNSLATETALKDPGGIAVTPDGSLYLIESGNNNTLSRISVDGRITTLAMGGSQEGTSYFMGVGLDSGGAITVRRLYWKSIHNVAVNQNGILYVTDFYGHRVFRLAPSAFSPSPPAPTVSLSVSPTTIQRGQSAVLSWSSANTTSRTIDQGIGSVGVSGSQSVSPTATTTYVINVSGPGGTKEASVTLTVIEPPPPPPLPLPPDINFSATVTSGQAPLAVNFTAVNSGGPVTSYTWSFGDGTEANTADVSVSRTYTAVGTYSVSVSASGPGGSDTETKTNLISVSNPPPPPPPPLPSTISLTVSPTTIQRGQSAVLSWSSSNTDSRTIDQGIGSVGVSGSQSVSPTVTTTYTASVTGSGGSKEVSVTLTVTEPPPPPPPPPPSPKLVVADPPKDFGEVIVGARMSYNARLWNENEGSLLVVSALEIAGRDAGDFAVSPSTAFSLIGKNYKDVAVIFLPGSAGRKEAELIIRHNGAESPLVISITGQGLLPPLAAPSLALPSNSAQNQPVQLVLSWSAVLEASLYRLQVATDSAFSRIVFDRSDINTSFMQIGPLSNNTLYYWRAQSAADERFSQWSALGRFTTTALANPKPIGRLVFDLDPALGDQKKISMKGVSANQTIPLQIYADEAKNLSGLFFTLEFDPETLVFQSFKEAFGFNPGLVEIRAGQVQLGSALFGASASTAKNGSVLIGTVKFVTAARFTSQSNTAVKIVELTVASLEEPLGRDQPLEIFSSAIATVSGERNFLAGDFNADGKVDFKDFLLFAQNFGKKGGDSVRFDLNSDGVVGFTDFLLFAAEFGKAQPNAKPLTISDLLAYLPAAEYGLMQNYPNPFNSETTISYELPEAGRVKLAVYDLSGQEIKILTDQEYQLAGQYQAIWDGRDDNGRPASSGLYLCRLEVANQFSYTRKMVFSK